MNAFGISYSNKSNIIEKPEVAIIVGSDSDLTIMKHARDILGCIEELL